MVYIISKSYWLSASRRYFWLFSVVCILCLINPEAAIAQRTKTVSVSTADEFIESIGSNRTIKLKAKRFVFSKLNARRFTGSVRLVPVFDGFQIEISDVKNLRIEGEVLTKLLTSHRYAYVLSFRNCENIVIDQVEAGHAPIQGYCTGGVFAFYNSKNIQVNNSVLFGSGTEGITLEGVEQAKFDNLTIRSCTYGIMTLKGASEVEFVKCRFTDNQEYDLINIYDSENISFTECTIDLNRAGTGADYDNYALINAPLTYGAYKTVATFRKCVIEDNHCQYLLRSDTAVKLEDCDLANNSVEKSYYNYK